MRVDTQMHAEKTFLLLLSDSAAFLIFWGHSRFFLPLRLCPHAVCSSEKPSAENCVSFSARFSLGTLLHVVVLYQLSDACGMPSVSHCPLHRHEVCVFTPGSLSTCRRIMGRVRGSPLFSSPHHSFRELISFSLWPAIIYSPVYFMAHFRISASLYVQANLHLQHCLYCVISIAPLCSVPCKTIRPELWIVVITLIPRCFIV